ncbi:MAG: ATP-binding protein [Armatimonadota bacterium]
MDKSDAEVIELVLPAENRWLQSARLTVSGVASRARLSVAQIEDLKLAVGEACTNAVEHAYGPDHPNPTIRIRCKILSDQFVVEVIDEGCGFLLDESVLDPKCPPAGEHGLGLFIICSTVDHVDIDTAPGAGTKVTMVKRALLPEDADPDLSDDE